MALNSLERGILGGGAGLITFYSVEDLYSDGIGVLNILGFIIAGATMNIACKK